MESSTPLANRGAPEIEFAATRPHGAKRRIIVTCMDPRIAMDNIYRAIGIQEHDAFILRNAGGRAQEALRSIIVGQNFLCTADIHIVHHAECGMAGQSEEGMQRHVVEVFNQNPSAVNVNPIIPFMVNQQRFLPIPATSVDEDCALVERYSLIRPGTEVQGWIYHIRETPQEDTVEKVPRPLPSPLPLPA